MMDIPLHNRTEVYINIYQKAKSELIRIGSLIDIEEEYIEQKFDEFLFEDTLKLQFIKYVVSNPYIFWRKVYCFNEDWEMFSESALRYSCSMTTETPVERILSIQKYIQNNHMTNISLPFLKARLQLHEQIKCKQKTILFIYI